MNFEEALVYELETIPGLNDKVFPLYASEGEEPPFVIYISSEGEPAQTLEGFSKSILIQCEIHIVGNSYSEMKSITRQIVAILQSFFGRTIGIDGAFIKSISYEQPEEVIEREVNLYRSSFDIKVRI